MTYQISIDALGQLGADGFAKLVEARLVTLREYDAHAATVRAHAADPEMPDEERWTPLAVPEAPFAEIDSAIRRTGNPDGTSEFAADYEIVGPSFESKKAKLFQQVMDTENAAQLAVLPPGKVRAYQFREQDIYKADMARRAAVLANDPVAAFDAVQARPADHTRFLEEQAAREDQRQEIMRWAANLHSDIEDLSPETIDAFEVKPFK